MILIVSVENDLHALTIRRTLASRRQPVAILECDRISAGSGLALHLRANGDLTSSAILPDGPVSLGVIEVVWWRRVRVDQQFHGETPHAHEVQLINNDCRGALEGALRTSVRGQWISDPSATDRASNKIWQLAVAAACGFRVPETLVSQSAAEVKDFTRRFDGRVIVKPVVGTAGPLLFTQFVGDVDRLDPASFTLAPALYQEFIPGTRHIRLNCFGQQSYAAAIDTQELDWRPNLGVPISEWPVPGDVHGRVRRVLDMLGLEMGIIDLKLTPAGELVWLEVNPQGQFLFLQGITGMPLAEYFADFLTAAANDGSRCERVRPTTSCSSAAESRAMA
jgi:glutathione synthase/RimK-type ligase-like ATP-grasp enzyme